MPEITTNKNPNIRNPIPPVDRIEVTDRAVGGDETKTPNKQLKSLANRDLWVRAKEASERNQAVSALETALENKIDDTKTRLRAELATEIRKLVTQISSQETDISNLRNRLNTEVSRLDAKIEAYNTSILKTNQANHNLKVGDPVFHNGTKWVQSRATTLDTAKTVGIVTNITGTELTICNGFCSIPGKGFIQGATYYLQNNGGIDTTPGTLRVPVFFAVTRARGWFTSFIGDPTINEHGLARIADGRLTYSVNESRITKSLANPDTLYYTSHVGNQISLWDNTDKRWAVHTFQNNRRIVLQTLDASSNYDIFATHSKTDGLRLIAEKWEDSTTPFAQARSKNLVYKHGVRVQQANPSLKYLGLIRIKSNNRSEFTAGVIDPTITAENATQKVNNSKLFLLNEFNKLPARVFSQLVNENLATPEGRGLHWDQETDEPVRPVPSKSEFWRHHLLSASDYTYSAICMADLNRGRWSDDLLGLTLNSLTVPYNNYLVEASASHGHEHDATSIIWEPVALPLGYSYIGMVTHNYNEMKPAGRQVSEHQSCQQTYWEY